MTKFHINKHGVPAPCKAKPGNCPLGGDDQHFNTREEAQIAADQKNEAEFSILPSTVSNKVELKVDEDAWEAALGKGGYHIHDGMTLGVHSNYLADTEETQALFNALPEDLKQEEKDGNGFFMVSDHNAKEYIAINLLSGTDSYDREEINEYFDKEILPSMQKYYPNMTSLNKYGEVEIKDQEQMNDIVEFAHSKLQSESNLKINGTRVFVDSDSNVAEKYSGKLHNRNWVKEYHEFHK